MVVSSANNRILDLVLSGRSLIYIKISIGPRTEPWGTPYVTGTVPDFSFSRTTVCFRPEKNACMHFKLGPLIPYWCRFSRSFWWLTLSNALEKSSKTMSVRLPAKEFLMRYSTRVTNSVSHECLLLKPCCKSTVGCDGPCEKPHLLCNVL